MNNLEVKITLCDPMNPRIGYQILITRVASPGVSPTRLLTSRHPVTGVDLLTFEQCLDVLALYRTSAASPCDS